MALPRETHAAARLHLYEPPDPNAEGGGRLSAELTLGEFYAAYVATSVARAARWAPTTRVSYAESVAHWGRLTDNLPLALIDKQQATQFVEGLQELPGRRGPKIATGTLRKHCTQVQIVLDLAGPEDRRKPVTSWAVELIERVPWIRPPASDEPRSCGDFSLAEVRALLAAAPRMHAPTVGCASPGDWWRALLLLLATTGLRIGETLALEWSMLEGQVLRVPREIRKRRRRDLVKWIRPDALAALGRLDHRTRRIFAYPQHRRTLSVQFDKLKRLADVANLAAFHGLRKFYATQLARNDLQLAADGLGHASPQTTERHYAAADALVAARIRQEREAAARLPDLEQRTLFDAI